MHTIELTIEQLRIVNYVLYHVEMDYSDTIIAAMSLKKTDLKNIERARAKLRDAIIQVNRAKKSGDNSTIEDKVIQTVCEYYNISYESLVENNRAYPLAEARQIAMYFIRRFTSYSFPRIARFFKRDHATALHAYNKVIDLCSVDSSFRNKVDNIEKIIIHE